MPVVTGRRRSLFIALVVTAALSAATTPSLASTPRDDGTLILEAPVLAFDRSNPAAGLAEIQRLSPDRIVVMSNTSADWLEELPRGRAAIIDTAPLPSARVDTARREPDAIEPEPFEHNQQDRFVTIIAGAVDRIRRKARPTYETYIVTHRVVVLAGDRWAPRSAGHGNLTRLGRYSDRSLVWWLTADGWIGTEPSDDAPTAGTAYVTERRASVATLNHLGSLAELPSHPLWRS